MSRTRWAIVACALTMGGAASAAPTKIPNVNGLTAEVPADLVPNGVGGAAGFHSKDGGAMVLVEVVSGDGLKKSMAQAKEEQLFAKKFLVEKKTADGWVLTFSQAKLNEDMDEVGVEYAFDVRRKVGTATCSCTGKTPKKEGLDALVALCNSIKPS